MAEQLEMRRVLAGSFDFGDAPDPQAGVGAGDYQTTLADDGPRHEIVPDLFLGRGVDADDGSLQSTAADLDEDDAIATSLPDFDLLPATTPELVVSATNLTNDDAVLAGWIDYNRDGVFDNKTERATATVPAGSDATNVTLVFPEVPLFSAYTTYARLRLSTDAAFTADPVPTGEVLGGEVEDVLIGRPTRIWDGEAGDNNIFNASNWAIEFADGTTSNANALPQSSEHVVIGPAFADQTILVSTPNSDRFSARSLQSAASLRIEEKGVIEIDADSRITNLALAGVATSVGDSLRAVSGFPKLTIVNDLHWTQAQINRLNIEVEGDLVIDSDRPKSLLASVLHVHGDNSRWIGGDINANGSSITNFGTWTSTSDADFLRPGFNGPSTTLVNAAGAHWIHDAPLSNDDFAERYVRLFNHGLIEVRSGSLSLGDCCSPTSHRGSLIIRDGAEVTLVGPSTYTDESTIETEAGSTLTLAMSNGEINSTTNIAGTVVNTGSVSIGNPITIPQLILDGGSIEAGGTLTVTNDFQFLRGVSSGSPFVNEGIMTLGAVDLDTGMTVRNLLINQGNATWVGRDLAFQFGTLRNEGTFRDRADASMVTAVFSTGTVQNHGTWTIDSSVGATEAAPRLIDFTNEGDLQLRASHVRFHRLTQAAGTTLLEDGTVVLTPDSLRLSGGVFAGLGTIQGGVSQTGGVLSPDQSPDFLQPAALAQCGSDLVGSGTLQGSASQTASSLSPGQSPAILQVDGDLTASDGDLLIEICGPPEENGTPQPGIHFDQLQVNGAATLAHINVEVNGGYVPQLDDRYTIVTANSISGPTSNDAESENMSISLSDGALDLVVLAAANDPPTSNPGGPYIGTEGSSLSLDGSASTDPQQSSESLVYHWDLNYDGTEFTNDVSGRTVDVSLANQQATRTIALRVTDDEGLSAIETTTLRVDNVSPQFIDDGAGSIELTLDSGRLAKITGTFVDPGLEDTHSIEILWGDGTAVQRVDIPAGERSFSVTHTYPNNETGDTRQFDLQVHVYDESEGSDFVALTLDQPYIPLPPTANPGGPYVTTEGTTFVLDGSGSSDPNQSSESLTYHWDFDYDGATFDVDASGRQVTHAFASDRANPFTVALQVTDNDGLTDLQTTTVQVSNVAPEWFVDLTRPRALAWSIDEDYVATLTGQFFDPGQDRHLITIDWGDGSETQKIDLPAGDRDFAFTHRYETPPAPIERTVSATVADLDGGEDTTSISVTINEPRAVVAGIKFDDRDGNGIQDVGELGLAGWEIQLIEVASGNVIASTSTDATGEYSFDDVPLGQYIVQEVPQTGWRQTFPIAPIVRQSVDESGDQADGHHQSPSISADGRFIAFSSLASDLVPGDVNGWRDVFVKDTLTGSIERISLPNAGGQANGPSYAPSISADGNQIAFQSWAGNLVQNDRNEAADIFVFDRRTQSTRRVSVNLDGEEANSNSHVPAISGDGRFVAFESPATNLVAGDTNAAADIFVVDLATGLIQLESLSSDHTLSDRDSYQPSLSHDGRFLVFTSAARTFFADDRDGDLDVFLRDRHRGTTQRISQDRSGTPGNSESHSPWVSGDGSTVAFVSNANNLFPTDSGATPDIFVADVATGRITQVTHGNGPSRRPSLTADGSQVWFVSHASDLITGDDNEGPDLFLFDLELQYVQRYGQIADGSENHFELDPVISADGSTLAFASYGDRLVNDDSNQTADIFSQRTIGTHTVTVASTSRIDGIDFGNQYRLSSISGQKFLDSNSNGVRDVDVSTGNFTEEGLDGWTIQVVDQRTGETHQTVTQSIDLDGDGSIDPFTERGHYQFLALPPAEYEVFELLEEGWVPTFPRLAFTPPLDFRAPVVPDPPPPGPSNDARLSLPQERQSRTQRVVTPVTTIPAVADGQKEQLPILYVKGFNDDGAGWAEAGLYFQRLADISGGRDYEAGSGGIETYGIQFWSTDDGDPNLDINDDPNDRSGAIVQTLDALANPNNPLRKPSAQEFVLESLNEIFAGLFQPANWIPECPDFPDLTTCSIPALSFDFVEARTSYNENGLARDHAEDLLELLQDQLGRVGPLSDDSQINFLTHSAGGLDTRAALALVQETGDPALQEAISNVVYTAPPFGGSTAGEMLNAFYENHRLASFVADPWVTEFLLDSALGPFESLMRLVFAEPIAASVYQASNLLSGSYASTADRIAAVPTQEEIGVAIDQTIADLDGFIKNITTNLPGGSFGLAQIDELLSDTSNNFTHTIRHEIVDDVVLPVIKQALTVAIGLPGLPKLRDDLRPYEAIHDNIERFDANLQIPQFVVWGEGGFLRYLAQMGGVDPSTPFPVNSGPPLELAASDPRSLHAYGNENREGLDFSQIDIQPGDGNLSRTSALFMTDLAGGYMTALAGFSRHTHGSIPTDVYNTETNIQGSFLDHDDDNEASLGEVIVETLLTPVTSVAVTEETVVVDADARTYRLNNASEISFVPESRTFEDDFGRELHVYASAVEYRVGVEGEIDSATWVEVDPDQFSRRAVAMTNELGIADEQPFTLQWRSMNQHGGREAIRTATFIVDTDAPSLQYVDVFDNEAPGDESQIHFAARPLLSQTFQSRESFDPTSTSGPTDWYLNLERGKQIHLEFDSALTFEYGWNDPNLSSPRTSVQGDPASGIVDLIVMRRDPGSIPPLGIGLTLLNEGTQVLYYRTSDANGNQSAMQSIAFFVDDVAPHVSLSTEANQIVGPSTPITFLANDAGAGVAEAWITLPGVGNLAPDSSFTLSETTIDAQLNSGDTVELAAYAADLVANETSVTLPVTYDFEAPTITFESVSIGTTLGDGRVITTTNEVTLVVHVADDAAGLDLDSLAWTVGALSNTSLVRGTLEPLGENRFEIVVPLSTGENHLQITAVDNVLNHATTTLTLLRSPSHLIETNRGDRIEGVDFGNTRFGSIAGVTYVDVDGDLRFTSGVDQPLEDIVVFADRNENGVLDPNEPTAQSDASGRYVLENLPPRTYVLRTIDPAGYDLVSPPSGFQEVTLGAIGAAENVSFGFDFLGATIAGKVFEDINANGTMDPGESPIEGFEVALGIGAQTTSQDFATTSNNDGSFSFTGLDAGDYTVLARGGSQFEITTEIPRVVSIASNDVDEKTLIGLFETTSISGAVFEDLDRDGNRDGGEESLAGFSVEIDYHSDDTIDEVVTSTPSGFSLSGLPAGTHAIAPVLPPGFSPTQLMRNGRLSFTIESGSQVSGLDFGVADERGSVRGKKFDDGNGNAQQDPGEPGLSGWTIFADLNENESLDAGEPSTVTQADGSYELRLPSGDYVIREVQQTGWVQTFPASVAYESISDANAVKNGLQFGGEHLVWFEFGSESKLVRHDGTEVVEVTRIGDGSITSVGINDDGTVSWVLDPDRSRDDDEDAHDIFQFRAGVTSRLTRNHVEDHSIVTDGNNLVYNSDRSLFYNDGEKTILLAQWGFSPAADGGAVAFGAIRVEDNRRTIYHFDGQSRREIVAAQGAILTSIDVHGELTAWSEFDTAIDRFSIWLDDGQTSQTIATGLEGVSDIQVDQFGNVAWLKWNDADNADVVLYRSGSTTDLTSDGGEKIDLSLDAGVAAWTSVANSTNQVFIFDGHDILEPDFAFAYGAVVDEGRVAFFAADQVSLSSTEVYVSDVRSFHAISIGSGQSINNIDFGNQAENATLSGIVYLDNNGNGVQDPGEPPRRSVTIELLSLPGRNLLASVATNEDGQFEFTVPGNEQVFVRAVSPSGQEVSQPSNGSYTVTTVAGEHLSDLNFGVAPTTSSDTDGVADTIENGAPGNGDGNDDGILDSQQHHVTSLPNAVDGTYVTIVAPAGSELVAVAVSDANPDPDNTPRSASFPVGFIHFEVHGIDVGETIDVTIHLHNNALLSNYYKYGPTPDETKPHFYPFERTSKNGIQSISAGEIVLRFTDGFAGDDDLAANGIIVDPGAPFMVSSGPSRNPVDPTDVNNDGTTSALDALLVINRLARSGDGSNMDDTLTFLDVNGDSESTALDALVVINEMARRSNAPPESEAPATAIIDLPREIDQDDELDETIELLARDLNGIAT